MADPLRAALQVIGVLVVVLLIVALIGGLVLCLVRRETIGASASKLAVGGLGLLIASRALGLIWNWGGYRLFTERADDYISVFALYGLFSTLVDAAGIGLLVVAVLAGRSSSRPQATP